VILNLEDRTPEVETRQEFRKCLVQPPTAETSNTQGLSGLDATAEDPRGWQAALVARLSLLDLGIEEKSSSHEVLVLLHA
jgi:hypothetical protein